MKPRKSIVVLAVAATICARASALIAQQFPNVVVYPQKGQTQTQQDKDRSECYDWAKANSSETSAGSSVERNRRVAGTGRGAAGGAALGAAGGAIAGDAGKGAAIGAIGGAVVGRRRARVAEQAKKEGAANSFDRAFAACMEGRGYTVK